MAWTQYLPWNAIRDFNDLVDEYFNYEILKAQNPTTITHKFDYYGNRRKQGVEPAYTEQNNANKVLLNVLDAVGNWAQVSPLGQDLTAIGQKVNHYITGKGDNPDLSQLNLFTDSGRNTTYIPTSNSAAGVADGTVETASPFDSYLTYLDKLREINEANNAFNVEQAQKQMDFQAQQNKIFMDFNSAEAQKSRDWQTEMSNTAYQRAAADMKAAGLNPVLAASGGNGASIGSATAASASGAATGSKATADNLFGSAMLSMMNSAMDIAEKSASAALTANAVAARGVNSSSGLNFKSIINGIKDFVSIAKGIKGLFS